MGTGYSRNDTSNNIADGNIINASDLDGEFDAIQSAFNASTGHTHDGTTAEGAPITVTGPAQEYVSTGTELRPKTNNTYDLGSLSLQWKDLYVDGTGYIDSVDIDGGAIDGTTIGGSSAAAGSFTTLGASGNATVGGTLGVTGLSTLASVDINGGNIDGTTIGSASAAAGTFTTATATTGNITTVNATTVDSTNVEVTNIKAKDGTASATIADSTGVMTIASSVLTTTDINGGTIDGVTIGGASAAAGTFTTVTASGDLTIADKIVHSGDTNTSIRFPAADTVTVETGGTERMRIDSSGNVGIGVAAPSSYAANANNLVIGGEPNVGITIASNSGTGNGGIYFADGLAGSEPNRGIIAYGHTTDVMQFFTSAQERLRIDASGNLLVGKTSADGGVNGFEARSAGETYITATSATPLAVNRKTSDGALISFSKDSTTVGSIGGATGLLGIGNGTGNLGFYDAQVNPMSTTSGGASDGVVSLGISGRRFKDLYLSGGVIGGIIGNGDTGLSFRADLDAIIPYNIGTSANRDNAIDLGYSSVRFDDIYATNALIQTSDRNEKQDIAELTEAERRVAVAAKGLLRKFRWKSAVEEKGDDARIHFGIIAQDLQAAFEAEGLDAGRYAMFIHSTWTDEETGEERSRMGVRYSELLAFIIAAI